MTPNRRASGPDRVNAPVPTVVGFLDLDIWDVSPRSVPLGTWSLRVNIGYGRPNYQQLDRLAIATLDVERLELTGPDPEYVAFAVEAVQRQHARHRSALDDDSGLPPAPVPGSIGIDRRRGEW